MLIGIEAEQANTDYPTGIEHYAQQLILAFVKRGKEHRYILYLRTPPKDWILNLPSNFSYKVMRFPRRLFYREVRLAWEMLRNRPEALFIMASTLPLVHPSNSVVTVHDIAWEFYPETFRSFRRTYMKCTTLFACLQARKVIAVSAKRAN